MDKIRNQGPYLGQLKEARKLACKILADDRGFALGSQIFESIKPGKNTPEMRAKILEKSKKSTEELVTLAEWSVEGGFAELPARTTKKTVSATFNKSKVDIQERLAQLKEKAAFWSTVDPQKYKAAHPDPLGNLPDKPIIASREPIGSGGFGVTETVKLQGTKKEYVMKTAKANKNGEMQKLVEAVFRREGEVGNALTARSNEIGIKSKVSDFQGLDVIVRPHPYVIESKKNKETPLPGETPLLEEILLQEKIQGMDGEDAIKSKDPTQSPFANGFVDDPQKAVERAAGLVLGLHSLHQAGRVHHDLKLPNIMVERQVLPRVLTPSETIKNEHIEAKAKQLLEKSLRETGELKSGETEKSVVTAWEKLASKKKKKLKNEAKKQLKDERKQLKDKVKYDYTYKLIDLGFAAEIGTWLGGAGSSNRAPEIFFGEKSTTTAYDVYTLGTILPSLLFGDGADLLTHDFYGWNGSSLSKFMLDLIGKPKEEIDKNIHSQFQDINQRMQQKTGKSYPEPVLERLAQMTADCLSKNPEKRPTAEQVLLGLQNMGLSHWESEQYNIQDVSQLTGDSAEIQEQIEYQRQIRQQFPWIEGA
ncbi:MAG: hypothetical protein LBN94_03135 [Puniceicoccales bacterium]|jgi:serine/threonine protein kinase|nr:hypothetical protein [Puniceicoccales bacterium]